MRIAKSLGLLRKADSARRNSLYAKIKDKMDSKNLLIEALTIAFIIHKKNGSHAAVFGVTRSHSLIKGQLCLFFHRGVDQNLCIVGLTDFLHAMFPLHLLNLHDVRFL